MGHSAGQICQDITNSNKKVPVNLSKALKIQSKCCSGITAQNPGFFTALSKQTQPSSELPVSGDRKIGVNLVKSLIQSVKRGEPGVKEEDVSAQLWGTSRAGASEHL